MGLYSGVIEKLLFVKQPGEFFSFPEVVPGDAKFPGSLDVHKGIVDEEGLGRIQFILLQNPFKNFRVRFFQVEAIGKINVLE